MNTVLNVQTNFVYDKNKTLKDLITTLLSFIVPENELNLYTTPDMMLIWTKAFTPESINIGKNLNYEELEYLGDRILKVTFAKYLLKRFPSYPPQYITNIDTLLMEKNFQAKLSDVLGLSNFVISNSPITLGIKGDLFESFFGASDDASNSIFPETGLINCYNMICFIFNQIKIPEHIKYGDTKMNVEQTFIQLGLPQPTLDVKKINNKFIVTLLLTDEHILFFIKHHIIIKDYTLGKAEGNAKNVTIKNAYNEAKKMLDFYKINEQFIENIKKLKKEEETEPTVVYVKPIKEKIIVDVKKLVTSLLSLIITNKNELYKYITPSNLKIWSQLFEDDKDIDKYRYYGEIIIKGLLPKHLIKIFPDYNKENFNNILSNISKHYDLFLGDEFKVLADKRIFETFFGMLESISDQNGNGVGLINCYRLIVVLFKKELIPEKFSVKHSKMILDQFFLPFFPNNKLAAKLVVEETHENDLYIFTISLSNEIYDFLRSLGFKLKTKEIGYAEGQYKKMTERDAYDNALTFLNNLGINEQWAIKTKNEMEFNHPSLLPYKKLLNDKNKKLGYDYIYFNYPTKTATQENVTIQLIGVSGKNKVILSSIVENVSDVNKVQSKIKLIKEYLNIK